MKTTDFIRASLEMSKGWIMGLAADMKDAPLVQPTPHGGNHPMWAVGHLTYSEANLIHKYARGGENPLAHWKEIFGEGAQPVTDAGVYPKYEEVLAEFEKIRAATLDYLGSLSDEDLDKPTSVPEEMRAYFGTVAQCFATTIIHFGFHGGQIADARRAAGREPLMA